MFNKTLHRPMFRKGGSTGSQGTGITSGLHSPRQGYDGSDGNQTVIQNDPTKVQQIGNDMTAFNKAFPQYNNTGSDFFLNLGSNILAAPGGNPILQTLGTAAKDPLLQMQKTNMANTQGNRELALKFWQSMDDDDKILVEKQMDFYMSKDGGNMSREEALEQIMFRKSQSPTDAAREKILTDESDTLQSVEDVSKTYKIGKPDAVKLQQFQKDIIEDMTTEGDKKYKLPYDGDQYYIEDEDILRKPGDDRLVIKGYDPDRDDYKDGSIYLDFITNTVYVKQGQFFVPYNTYVTEEISTN